MAQSTRIDILRHGEPVGGSRYRGDGVDDPLTEDGWVQMWAAVAGETSWSRIITSPLQRCHAFAEALASKQGLPLEVEPRIREVGFGRWEGRMRRAVMAEELDNYKRFYADPVNARPAGAESLLAFYRRVTEALHASVSAYPGKDLLMVAHAGVVRCAVSMAVEGALHGLYRIKVDYANITRIAYSSEHGFQLVFHGRTQLGELTGGWNST